jgi:hypothetical protein
MSKSPVFRQAGMSEIEASRVNKILSQAVGPAPWYWQSFPVFRSLSGQKFVWTHHGEEGPLAHLITLGLDQDRDKARLALNTYCRPFLIPPHFLGIWCPEGRNLRFACFDPDQLQAFDLAEVAGWFKPSSDRIYSATAPVCDFETPLALGPGTHNIQVPPELATVDELIVPTSYKAMSNDDPAFALFTFYFQAGLVEVLPQKWFTSAQYRVGQQWITRAVRDPDSNRIAGECFGVGTFLLEEDNCRLAKWLARSS